MRSKQGIGAGLLLVAVSTGCVPLPRYPSVAPRSEPAPVERLAKRLDPWLLAEGLADKVVVEVDWVEGCEPAPLTLEGLLKVLVKYGPPGRPVEIERDDAIPRSEWDAAVEKRERDPFEAMVSSYADPLRDEGTEHRYVLFAPRSPAGYFGVSWAQWVEREGVERAVSGVVVFRDTHARYDILWVSLDEIERMTLVHEFGHQFGLVSDPRHERSDARHRIHCTRLDCSMAHPTKRLWWRNIWRGLFDVWFKDYCPECQDEIRIAQEEWRKQRASDPDWVADIRADRDRREQDARLAAALWRLAREEDWDAVLREVKAGLADTPNSVTLWSYRVRALSGLGRVDESIAALASFPAETESRWAQEAWSPARALIAEGRHEEALSLLARVMDTQGNAPNLEPYYVEQTSFIVLTALEGLGRFREAAALALRLGARESAVSYFPSQMAANGGDLLRRAGELDRAEVILAPLYRAKRSREWAVEPLYRLRVDQGREVESGRILAKAVAKPLPQDAAEADGDDWNRSWKLLARARRLALLGRKDEAEVALDRFADGARNSYMIYVGRAEVLVALGRVDESAKLMSQWPETERGIADPCGFEWLVPFRSDPRFDEVLARCPPQKAP